jgi:hypothetical protein
MTETDDSANHDLSLSAKHINKWLRLDKMELVSVFASQLPSMNRICQESERRCGVVVFLSYARSDQAIVERLYDQLKASGLVPWMDVRDIYPGENWKSAIETAIQKSDFFVLCLSSNSVNRRGTLQREIQTALDKLIELLKHDIYFIPVRLTQCTRPPEIAKYQSVDLFESGGYERLISAFEEGIARRRTEIE